jgi:hypothetical protein
MSGDSSATESLWIEERGDEFVLVRIGSAGRRSEFAAPRAGLIFLGRLIPQALQKWLASHRSKTGAAPIVAVPAEQIPVSIDIHGAELLVTMIEKPGNEAGFAVSPETARAAAGYLIELAAEIDRSPKHTKQ